MFKQNYLRNGITIQTNFTLTLWSNNNATPRMKERHYHPCRLSGRTIMQPHEQMFYINFRLKIRRCQVKRRIFSKQKFLKAVGKVASWMLDIGCWILEKYLLSLISYLLSKITLVDARRAFHVLQDDRLNGSLERPPYEFRCLLLNGRFFKT